MKPRMIIISLDAVGGRDFARLKEMPHCRAFLEKAAVCENVESVYPSITYPAHATIVTGRKPCHHGVINNTKFQPGRKSPDWMWERACIHGTTLYDGAIKKGYRVAAFFWPVTAKSKIQYNLPEIFANRPYHSQILVSLANGTVGFQLDLATRFKHMTDGLKQPALDDFLQACVLYSLPRYSPDMALIHFTDVDAAKHHYGTGDSRVEEALVRHDRRIGEIMGILGQTGNMDETTVVILGDHDQKDVKKVVYLNYIFRKEGFLLTHGEHIVSYKVMADTCDGSCYIRVHPDFPGDRDLLRRIERLLLRLQQKSRYGIEGILTGQQAAALGADPHCAFMVEAKEGYYFLNEWEVPYADFTAERFRAVHGYLPAVPDYNTFFAAAGYGILPGATVDSMTLCDVAPTLARILEVDLGKVDGKVLEGMLPEGMLPEGMLREKEQEV